MSNELSSTACPRPTSRWKMIPRVIGKYFFRLRTETRAPSAGGESEPTEAGVETLIGPGEGRSYCLLEAPRLTDRPKPPLLLDREVTRLRMPATPVLEGWDLLVARLEPVRTTRVER